jgi:hypothetical protein
MADKINNRMNKKGDIPVTILVLLVIVIYCMAIYSFLVSMSSIRNSFVGIGLTEELNSQVEQSVFNNQNPAGLYLEEKENQGILFWQKPVVLFSVEYQSKP